MVTELPELVVMSHSLEHLLNPGETLRKIFTLMPKDGKLLLALPNADVGRRFFLRKSWGYWQVPVHTVHLGAKTFPSFLQKSGFEVKSISFRSFDLLTLGSTILNTFRVKSVDFGGKPSLLLRSILPTASRVWSLLLGAGKSEMLILVSKP
jgi:predicted SAM-dependent methyltransferase